ncbi:MAG: hypothetical protein IH863_00785 [Chloroflexi bacterium]|nr:hypothetical protein [Chloroflexota bacterium]
MSTAVMPRTQSEQLRLPMRDADKPRVRSDALPEFTRYRDNGCDVHPSCLTCPLPRCRYEEPGGLRALLNKTRDAQIVAQRATGVPVAELATRFGVSRRTVFRVLGNKTRQPIPIHQRDQAPANGQTRREAHCA